MKKIILFLSVFFTIMLAGTISAQQHDFAAIPGPTLVAQGTPVTLNINDAGNMAGVPVPSSGTYSSFSVSVDWANNNDAFSSEADLRMTTTAGSILIDPATTGSAGSTTATTMTFEGEFTTPYDPSVDGFMDIVLRQSWSGSSANWSNIVVTIFPTPTCIAPDGLSVANITTNSVDLTWNVGANTDFEYVIQLAGTGEPTINGIYADNNTLPLTVSDDVDYNPLTPATTYEVWVRADCGGNGYSTWFGPVNFATACVAITDFNQDFDSVTTPQFPTCWRKVGASGSADTRNSNPNSAPNSLYMYSSSTSNLAVVAMPPLSNLGAGTHRLKFDMRANFTVGGIVEFGYLTDPADAASFVSLQTATASSLSYQPYVIMPAAGVYSDYPAFRHTGSPANSLLIDDVVWEPLPSCIEPNNLTVSNVTASSVDLNWNDLGGTTDFEYAIQLAGTGEPSVNGIYADYNTLPLTATDDVNYNPLAHSTAYEVWVRADCGGNGYSTWVGPVNFTTSSLVTCGTPENVTYCYTNNDTTSWTYTSNDGSPLRVTFNAGQVEVSYDELIVFDSDGVTELYNGYGNSGDLAGLVFDASGDSITIQITSDGSASCSSSGYTSWDFTVACATCVNPAATFTTVSDCANSQYSIDVDVTSLGTATSLSISDGTTTLTNISALGIQTFGPYASGASATIVITNEQDASCSASSGSISYFCPPANDECSGAIALTVNADLSCAVQTAGTITSATASSVDTAACGGTENDDVWYSFVAESTSHVISLNNVAGSTTDLYHSVWTGADCNSLTLVPGTCSDPNSSTPSGLTIGTTYYIRIYSWGSTAGQTSTFNVCVGTIPPPPSNDECDNAIALTVNTDYNCGVVTSATNASATASPQADDVTGTPNNDVWFSFVATQTAHRISLTNIVAATGTSTDMGMGVYDATGGCSALTFVADSDPDTLNLTSLTIGNTYLVRVYNWGSNAANTDNFDICVGTDPALNSSSFDTANFKAYPNPVNDILNLEYKSEMSNVQVINLLGQTVINRTVNATSTQVDMSQLNAGAYIVNVTIDGAIQTIKVVKK